MGFTTMIELVELIQLIGCVMFIAAMRWLSTPQFANRGNLCSAGALLLIVGVLLCSGNFKDVTWIVLGMLGGIAGGFWIAQQTQSTAIQQHVVLLNGFGAGASLLVAGLGFGSSPRNTIEVVAAVIAGLLSAVGLSGSLTAFAKLEKMPIGRNPKFSVQHRITGSLLAVCLVASLWIILHPQDVLLYWVMVLVALVLGYFQLVFIARKDMPIVISVLNAFSGFAASATGILLSNTGLIVAGALVGASGFVLTGVICKTLNRAIRDVLFGVGSDHILVIANGEDLPPQDLPPLDVLPLDSL
jgi:NAD(P) transhydrogenase subunit beta